jgi:ABC-type transport system involved in multi-copper enzyme maturation permease subunit
MFSRGGAPLYVLAAMPVIVALLCYPFTLAVASDSPGYTTRVFAQVFLLFVLRFVVFLGCAFLFIRSFRGEILERSFHYTLLSPVRREVLVAGKYLGGLLTAFGIFLPTTALSFLLMYVPHLGLGLGAVYTPTIIGHLGAYLGVVALACLGYGALFLFAGLSFRNPLVPAVLFLGWEFLTPFLPAALKALSFVHYLRSLMPVPPKLGPFAVFAQPVAPAWAVVGIVLVSAALLTAAWWKLRRVEISYAAE